MSPVVVHTATASNGLRVAFEGDWVVGGGLPPPERVLAEIARPPLPPKLTLDGHLIGRWDSGLLTFLMPLVSRCAELGVEVERRELPDGVTRLLALATAVPPRSDRRNPVPQPALTRIGDGAVAWWSGCCRALAFVGDASVSVLRLFARRARFRRSECLLIVQDCGARALPIVSLVSLLVGLILAFVGAIQLRMFGAQVYVAHLVGIATVREIGAIMTGIIVTGRTGASFAAQLGTMQVNEEIDALRTLGLRPMDFLVLPRLLALALMMPLLCLYADLMGILGGLVVGVAMLDIHPVQYFLETQRAIHLADLSLGVFMSVVFGIIVALTGCMRGIASGRSASAVGEATTSAVVTGIISIVVATAIITYGAYVLGI